MDKSDSFYESLKFKMDKFAHRVYSLTKGFPKEEIYGVTSQLRRASLSVALNFVEGYARRRKAVALNFFEISYGSLKESVYLLDFSFHEGYINSKEKDECALIADNIGAMLWGIIKKLEK